MNFAANFPTFSRFSKRRTEAIQSEAGASQRGWALLSVLWVTAMLAMMAAATQALTVTSVRIERRALNEARLDADIKAGIVRAILAINNSRAENRWRVDGVPQNFVFDGVPMTVFIQEETGKVDLNSADPSLLSALFVSVGMKPQDASALSNKISDWRTATGDADLHRLNGATDADYAAAGLPYRQRHGPFQTIEELNLVLGMTPALFARVKPAVTVYSRSPSIDPNVAPREALGALYPQDPGKVQQILAARMGAGPLNADSGIAGPPGIVPLAISPWGQSFTVTVKAEFGHRRVARSAVALLTGDDDRPYLIQAWE